MRERRRTLGGQEPTPVRHPWRTVLRGVIVALLALIPILPEIIETSGLGTVPWIAAVGAVAAAITRVLALPAVEAWLRTYLPGLAAEPYYPRHLREDDDHDDAPGDAHGRARPGPGHHDRGTGGHRGA